MYETVIQNFRNTFAGLKDRKLALYGTGNLTLLLLETCPDFSIAGVMDCNTDKRNFGGKPVIPVEKSAEYGLYGIIVAARKSSAMIIRNRILDSCRRSGVKLLDLYGNDLDSPEKSCAVSELLTRGGSSADRTVISLFSRAYRVWAGSRNARQFGYTFAAPVITAFCFSLLQYAEEEQYDTICLLSRDGYLIKKCLEILKGRFGGRAELIYLLTSRIALTDESSRQNYFSYLMMQGLEDRKILIVDFAAAGTCQRLLETLLCRRLDGYYFIHIKNREEPSLHVNAFYSVLEYDDDKSALYALYPLLELLVSSTGPSLAGMNENIEPVYCEAAIAPQIAEDIARAQEGVLDFLREYCALAENLDDAPDLKLCDDILRVGSNEDLKEIPFLNAEYYDNFYGRTYELPLTGIRHHKR